MSKAIKIFFIVAQLSLGALFVFAGVRKFIPSPARKASSTEVVAGSTQDKMIKFISGLKANSYFWPFLGIVEIMAGLLLISQFFAVAGAIVLFPLTLNIFLFHIFLKPDDTGGGLLSAIYLMINILIIAKEYKHIKSILYTNKPFQL